MEYWKNTYPILYSLNNHYIFNSSFDCELILTTTPLRHLLRRWHLFSFYFLIVILKSFFRYFVAWLSLLLLLFNTFITALAAAVVTSICEVVNNAAAVAVAVAVAIATSTSICDYHWSALIAQIIKHFQV